MHARHDRNVYLSLAGQVAHTFRHLSMWTIPLVMSITCVVWGLGSLFLGKVDGPGLISWNDAALMSTLGLFFLCYVLVADYLRNRSVQTT